jgi:pimeloyl-ACP methyl ester carboxylesterase
MKRFLAVAVTFLVGASFSILMMGWLLGRPVQRSVGSPPRDFNAEPVSFASDADTIVHGWWCPVSNSHGAVLLLPGIRADRVSMIGRAQFLRRAGYSVLLIDFQATGETKGHHITFGWRESRDVLAAVDFIRKHDSNDHIAIIGSSLGGAAALLAAPPLKVDALVLEAVYPTIEIATRNRLENYLGKWGGLIAPLLLKQLHPRLEISVGDLRPVDHIGNINCPVLIMSGAKDRNTRPGDTQMLFSRARSVKQLWLVPNAGHVDLHRAAAIEYEERVLSFFDQAFAANGPSVYDFTSDD